MTDKQTQLLNALAEKLGTTAQYLWSVLVRGNLVTGFYDAFVFAISACLVVVGYKLIRCGLKKDGYDDEPYIYGGIFCGLVGVIVGFITGYYATVLIFSPEYGALTDILGALK